MISGSLRRCGFTAVEMIATMALASLLMLAVLAVISSVGRTRSTVQRHEQPSKWLETIEPIIHEDLVAARSIEPRGQILLKGYGAINPTTLARTQKPAEVHYLVKQKNNRSLLLREQRTFSDAKGVEVFTQIIAVDVAAITLTDLEENRRVKLTVQSTVPSQVFSSWILLQ